MLLFVPYFDNVCTGHNYSRNYGCDTIITLWKLNRETLFYRLLIFSSKPFGSFKYLFFISFIH